MLPKMWNNSPLPGVSLDATGLIALADLTTIAQRTALNGNACLLDLLVLCRGIHHQQHATDLNKGELPPTAALTSGYVFRVENQSTVFYLQKMGVCGHLVTLAVEELPHSRKNQDTTTRILEAFMNPKSVDMSFLFYVIPIVLTLFALAFMILIQDFWGLAVLLILICSRGLNVMVIRRRSQPAWNGTREPGANGDLLILLSQDRWIRLQGKVDALKAVTSGQWLRDMTFVERSLTAVATLLVYIDAALAGNASQGGKIAVGLLLLISAGLLALSNETTTQLHMYGYVVRVTRKPERYARRLDLADELIKATGHDGWAIRLGMINQKSGRGEITKVLL